LANQNFRVKHGLEVSGNTLVTGITTVGSLDTAVADIISLSGSNIVITGIASLPTLDTTNGEINYLTGVNLEYSGIASVTKLEATNAFVGVAATITTIDVTNGTIDILSGTDINVSGAITASSFTGDLTGGVIGNVTGNADSATVLQTSREFSVSGDVATAAGVSFDGSANVNLSVTLSNSFDASTSGIITASKLSTGAIGTGIYIDQSTISGPSEIVIDPAGVGDNTGSVRIKGDLLVDGQQFIINSETITLGDFVVGIASTATTDALADGAGIQIGLDNTLLYDHTNTALKSSENFNLAEGKSYKINGTDVLSYNTLGSTILDSSLTSVGTLVNLNVSGIVTATTFDGNLTGNVTGNVTGIAEQASELVTSRTFSILGDVATATGVSFDGTADVGLTVSLSNSFDANTSGIITATKFDGTDLNVSGMATINQIHLEGLSPDGTTFGVSNYVPVANGSGGWSWQPIAAAGGGSLDGISVLEEGSSVGAAGSIISVNFTGDNVTATATGTAATIDFNDSPTYQNIVSIESSDGTSGRLDLYCESQNAHYTRLQAAPHADYSGNPTVILPVIDGTMIVGGANTNTENITTSGDITANSFVKSGGASSEFLKADGSVDSNTYLTAYTETQTLDDVLTLGYISSTGIQVGISTVDNQLSITSSDGTVGRLDLYCESENLHYTRLQAAPHSTYSGNAIVTVPNTSGTLLLTDGDGSSLTGIVTSITAGSGISIDQSTGNVTISGSVVGSIDDLSDVDTSSVAPTEGQTLLWDSANSQWEPGTVSGLPSVNAIIPVALARVTTTTSGSGVGVTWGNWNSGNSTLDFTFDVPQPDTNYAVITDSEQFDDRSVGISIKTTTGFRAEFYDSSNSRTPSTSDPYTFLIYGSDPRSNVAVAAGAAEIRDGGSAIGIATVIDFGSNLSVSAISAGIVTITGGGGITEIVQDTTPQLGGDLDLNSKSITGTGNISITGIVTATDFNSSSDINLKNNVRLIEDPLSKVMSIRGVNFEWKQNSETSAGVIAQEIEEVMPELVNEVDGRKTVNYNGLIGLLVEVVKDQQKQIDELKEKLS
jgi:hypothetical protein